MLFKSNILDSYLPKNGETHENPLISPIFADDEILQQFPQHLTIASAGLDPLLDDAIKMVKRFENLGLPIHHKVFFSNFIVINFFSLIRSMNFYRMVLCNLQLSQFLKPTERRISLLFPSKKCLKVLKDKKKKPFRKIHIYQNFMLRLISCKFRLITINNMHSKSASVDERQVLVKSHVLKSNVRKS